MQHVPAADRVAGDHRHDRLGQPADLHVQVGHVEAPDARRLPASSSCQVARVAAHALVAAGAERLGPSPVSTITPIAVSSRASSSAAEISMTVRGRNALRTSGRAIVIFAMPSLGAADFS